MIILLHCARPHHPPPDLHRQESNVQQVATCQLTGGYKEIRWKEI